MSADEFDWDAVIDRLRAGRGLAKDFGNYAAPDEPTCLIGAMRSVLIRNGVKGDSLHLNSHTDPLCDVALKIAREQFPDREIVMSYPHTVAAFNDHPDTTLEDIILVCEKARAASGELS